MLEQRANRWRHYIPAMVCYGLVVLILAIPLLAVLFVVIGLSLVGATYALVVYRMHQAQDAIDRADYVAGQDPDPTFKNVTINVVNKARWFRDLN